MMGHSYNDTPMDEWRENLMAIANGEKKIGFQNHEYELVSWDPKKHEIELINTEEGRIIFKKISQGEPE